MQGLLEREAELGALARTLDDLNSGAGGAILIDGPPGIGKTALMDAALAGAGSATVLRARGTELESELAFGGVRQLFMPPVLALDGAEREALLEGPAGLARPVLGLAAASPAGALGDPLFGLYWLAVELSERAPVVLAIDDVHWLDAESGRFVAYLAARVEGTSVLLLATARPHEPGAQPGPAAAIAEHGTVVSPAALSSSAAERLLPGAHAQTGGNPLLITELRRALDADPSATLEELGSASIAKLVLSRVARISADAVALVHAIALFAEGATLDDAALVAGVDPAAAANAADRLVAVQVLTGDDVLRFVHPVMRRSVYDDIGPFNRRLAHARAAQLLKQRGAPPAQIASHLLEMGPQGDPGDARILLEAADDAESRLAPAAAARYVERALEQAPEGAPRVRARLGRLQALTGRAEAAQTLRTAVSELTDTNEKLDAAILYGKVAMQGEPDVALAELTRLRETAESDPQRALALDALIAGCLLGKGDYRRFREMAARIPRDLPGETAHERHALSMAAIGAAARGEPAALVRELTLRSMPDPAEPDDDVGGDAADSTDQLIFTGDLDLAEAFAQERLDRARERGTAAPYVAAQIMLMTVAAARGDLGAAEANGRLALAAGPSPREELFTTWRLVPVVLRLGRIDDAAALTADASFGPEALRGAISAHVDLARGDAGAAAAKWAAMLESVVRPSEGSMVTEDWFESYADALIALGRSDEAAQLMHDFLRDAERIGETRLLARAHRGLGLACADRAHLERAHELLDGSQYRYDAARARLDLGMRLRRDGERSAARELMLPALEYAERERAAPLAKQLREELAAVGSRPRSAVRTGVDALTASEGRIARLAADGLSNKQIAQNLFLTVKTVEMHLAGAYRKLGINSRRDLAAALGEPMPAASD